MAEAEFSGVGGAGIAFPDILGGLTLFYLSGIENA
jgi:hypothetical protein